MNEWDRIRILLHSASINRRDFLASAIALGISSNLISEALAATPKHGGHLVVGMPAASTSDSLDPTIYRVNYMLLLGNQLYDTLAELDEHVQAQPFLAESWDSNPNAQEWIIKLRKGVIFHNGKEMTSADVVYSLNHHREKNSKSAAKIFVRSMVDIQATGKYEVTIKLDSANVDFPYLLTLTQLVVLPEGMTNQGIGTGAFTLETFEPGVRALTKRNKNDWNKHRGYVDSVETLGINDPAARLSALLSGTVHLTESISPNAASAVEKNPQTQLFTVNSFSHDSFDMQVNVPPFDNLELRQALKYAIDRDAILKTVLRGYGNIGNDQPISHLDPMYASDIPQRSYDPDKAKFLAKKAGFSGTVTLTVADATFVGALEAAEIFQSSAAKAGINLKVDHVPSDGYYVNVFKKLPFVGNYSGGRPTAGMMFDHGYFSTAYVNDTNWNSPKFDNMLLAARAEFDVTKRKQIYRDMQLMLHEEGGAIIPVFINYLDAGHKKVKGFVTFPLHAMSGYRAPEKVWLDS